MDPAAMDFSTFNWLGFALAIVSNIVIGFVWYANWFPTGKAWARELKVDMTQRPPPGAMAKSMGLMLVGVVLLMFVYAHNMMVYEDAYRNQMTGGMAGYKLGLMDGVMGGLFTWLGFFVPVHLNLVAFEHRSWKLFGINVGYYLVVMVVAGVLIATVGAK
ncbi:MAG: DUF1761 domain-containing protein [Thermoplasmatota archaeon]